MQGERKGSGRDKREGGEGRGTYLSITCMTPFATMISVMVTCAELTKTFLSTLSMATSSPPRTVGNVSFARPEVRSVE